MKIDGVTLKRRIKKSICAVLCLTVLSSAVSIEIAGVDANAASAASVTAQDIQDGLGSARYFGILANKLGNSSALNFESNIAVANITGSQGEIGNVKSWGKASAGSGTVTLSISAPQGTYQFGIYQDAAGTQLRGEPFWIEPNKDGTVQKTITGLTPNKTYYAYLIQNGKVNTAVGAKLTATSHSSSDDYASINYIKDVNYQSDTTIKVKGVAESPSKVYFGDSCSLEPIGNGSGQGYIKNKKQYRYLVDEFSSVTTTNQEKFPVSLGAQGNEFAKETYDSLSKLSSQLSQCTDSAADAQVKVINLNLQSQYDFWSGENIVYSSQIKAALCNALGYGDYNDLANKGISLFDDQYLVINFNVDKNCDYIDMPEIRIGGVNPGSQYDPIARRVLWNFGTVTKDVQIYSSAQAGMLGTILAPTSDVQLSNCLITGAVYADEVNITNGGGLKRATFQVGSSGVAAVTVPSPSAEVKLQKTAKMQSDGRTAEITLTPTGSISSYTSIPKSEVIMMLDRSTSMKLSVDGTKHGGDYWHSDGDYPEDQGSSNYKKYAGDSRLAILKSAAAKFMGKLTQINTLLPSDKQIDVANGGFCWTKRAVGNSYFSYLKDDPMNTQDYNAVHNADGEKEYNYNSYRPHNTSFEGTFINGFTSPTAAGNQIANLYPSPYTCLDAAIDKVSSVLDHTNGKKKYVIFISDGEPNGPDINGANSASLAKQYMSRQGISGQNDTVVYSAFIGSSDRGEAVMRALATSDENYLQVTDDDALNNVFKKIEEGILSYSFDNSTTLTDTLPAYFMLTAGQQKAIASSYPNSTVTVNADNTTTITWKNLTLGAAQDIKFQATVRNDYFANPDGKKVSTNLSAVLNYTDPISKTQKTATAPLPMVQIEGNAVVTGGTQKIKLGEQVNLRNLSKFTNSDKSRYGDGATAGFTTTPNTLTGFTWQLLDTNRKTVLATSSNGTAWYTQSGKTLTVSPNANTTYYLKVINAGLYKNANGEVVERDFNQIRPLDIQVESSGTITLHKELQGGGDQNKEFTVQVRGGNGYAVDLPLTAANLTGLKLTNLQPGTYTIHEVVPQNYKFLSMAGATLADSAANTYQVVISAQQKDYNVTVKNSYQPSSYFYTGDSKTNTFQTSGDFQKPN